MEVALRWAGGNEREKQYVNNEYTISEYALDHGIDKSKSEVTHKMRFDLRVITDFTTLFPCLL